MAAEVDAWRHPADQSSSPAARVGRLRELSVGIEIEVDAVGPCPERRLHLIETARQDEEAGRQGRGSDGLAE